MQTQARRKTFRLLLVALSLLPGLAEAALIGRLPATPGGTHYRAYYDDVLKITWLGDANLAASNRFGVGGIGSNGAMNWDTAKLWVAAMNVANYLGFSDWRLPTLSPVSGGATFATGFSNNGITDVGFGQTGIGWDTGAGAIVSEMG